MGKRHKDFPVCEPGYVASLALTYNHSLSLSYPSITVRYPMHTTTEQAELSQHLCSVARRSKVQDSSWQLTQSLVPGGGDYIKRCEVQNSGCKSNESSYAMGQPSWDTTCTSPRASQVPGAPSPFTAGSLGSTSALSEEALD